MSLGLLVWQRKESHKRGDKGFESSLLDGLSIWKLMSLKMITRGGMRERQNLALNSLVHEGKNMESLKMIPGNSRW